MYPNTIGSYWINQNYSIDTLGNINTKSLTTDSTIVTGMKQLDGKLATEFSSISSATTTKSYNAKEANKVFISADGINSLLNIFSTVISVDPSKITLDEKWLMIADQSQSSWKVANKTFSKVPFTFATNKGTFSGTTLVNSKKGNTQNFDIQGTSYSAQEYVVESNITINLSVVIDPLPIPLPAGTIKITNVQHYWFANGVGLVKTQTDNTIMDINITLANLKQKQNIPGNVKNCIRFNLPNPVN